MYSDVFGRYKIFSLKFLTILKSFFFLVALFTESLLDLRYDPLYLLDLRYDPLYLVFVFIVIPLLCKCEWVWKDTLLRSLNFPLIILTLTDKAFVRQHIEWRAREELETGWIWSSEVYLFSSRKILFKKNIIRKQSRSISVPGSCFWDRETLWIW